MPTPAPRPHAPSDPAPTQLPDCPERNDWAAGLRAGDEAAFEAVFRAQYARLCDAARVYLRTQELAEEVVQELFLRLWRQHDRLEITGPVEAYLFRAVRNASLSRLRHYRVEHRWREEQAAEPPPGAPTAEEHLAEADLAQAIARAVDELPERCRLIFTLNRHRGLTYDQIAASLALSRKTVETQMGRAIRSLRNKLRPYLPS